MCRTPTCATPSKACSESRLAPGSRAANSTPSTISGSRARTSRTSPALRFATNLHSLWARRNEIADLSPLADASSLLRLEVSSNRVADIAALAGLTQLTELFPALEPDRGHLRTLRVDQADPAYDRRERHRGPLPAVGNDRASISWCGGKPDRHGRTPVRAVGAADPAPVLERNRGRVAVVGPGRPDQSAARVQRHL